MIRRSRASAAWTPLAVVLLTLLACDSAAPAAAPDAPPDAPRPAGAVPPAAMAESGAGNLPVGEEPPPPGTHFVDVARATTVRRGHYPEFQYVLPSRDWPPVAYRHGLGMRVRWGVIHSCLDGRPGRLQLRDGVVSFAWTSGRPARCGSSLSEFETSLPPGNDAVHALRGPGGPVMPLPEVLSVDPPRRGLRSGQHLLDPWGD